MLSQSLNEKLKSNKDITIFDPAVGSGAFLVESYKTILTYSCDLEKLTELEKFNKKKEILENQLFGVDIDKKALQIATFSLYLAIASICCFSKSIVI